MQALPASLDPPIRDGPDGVRRVGVEIELTGLDVRQIADTVADVFGGDVTRETDYLARVATSAGEFRVEADLRLLQRIGWSRAQDTDSSGVAAAVRDVVATVAEHIAPFEVASPPLPYPSMARLDALALALGERGGRGTDAGLLMVLGLQLNPEVPARTAESIHAHLRAYALLEPWLRMRRGIDVSRRLMPFVDPYPAEYVELLIGQRDPPPLAKLIDDYLELNPTRNRSLDMLPLFSELDRERVAAVVANTRVNRRPTFHYRLPDSRVGDPSWRITDEWRHWLVIERVAARKDLLDVLASAHRDGLDRVSMLSAHASWAERCDALLAAERFGADRAERLPHTAS